MEAILKVHLHLLGPCVNSMTIALKHMCKWNVSVSVLYFYIHSIAFET